MALFCLMTVCACACLRLVGGIPGEPADCHTPIKQTQIYSKGCVPAKYRNGNTVALWLKSSSFAFCLKKNMWKVCRCKSDKIIKIMT